MYSQIRLELKKYQVKDILDVPIVIYSVKNEWKRRFVKKKYSKRR